MGFNWDEYGELAEETLNIANLSDEVKWRNYCSRVYYNCYHRLLKLAFSKGFKKEFERAHKKLLDFLKEKGMRWQAGRLKELKVIREQCDYDDKYPGQLSEDFEKLKSYSEELLKMTVSVNENKAKN